MQRIDGPFNVLTKPEKSPPANDPGYFSGGDPKLGRRATRVTKDWLNMIQEEICTVIVAAGLVLNRDDDTQLWQALQALFGLSPGPGGGGQVYVTEFKNFYEQSPPPGWAWRNGGLLVGADVAAPKLWDALRQPENAWKCKTQAEWDALSQAQPWNGVGGVPFFVIDVNAKTIRLPDTRGMYMEDIGFDSLGIGGVHGDAIRNLEGGMANVQFVHSSSTGDGVLSVVSSGVYGLYNSHWGAVGQAGCRVEFNAANVVPTAGVNRPRAFGMLGCVYVGGME